MNKKITELSLFSGMGGGIYGSLILGWKTLAYVEKDEYCRRVIKQRIEDGWFDSGEVFGDIKEFNKNHAKQYRGKIDVLTGGFPCQPFSVAGKRKGTSDERYLFDEIIKTIKIIQPRRLLFENVPGILASNAIIKIYESLSKIGYRPKPPLVLGSADCGNIHKRERVWIFADSSMCRGDNRENNREGRQVYNSKIRTDEKDKQKRHKWLSGTNENINVYDTDNRGERIQGKREKSIYWKQRVPRSESIRGIEDIQRRPDIPEPLLWGVDDELSDWSKQLKAIGNGQDPIVMATAYGILSGELLTDRSG